MYQNIKTKELLIFLKQHKQGFTDDDGVYHKPCSLEELVESLEVIDDLLTIMKSKSLLNKKRGLKQVITGRLALACGEHVHIGGNNFFK